MKPIQRAQASAKLAPVKSESGRAGACETSPASAGERETSGHEGARKNGAEGSRTPVPIHMKSRIYACSRPFNLGLRSVGRRRAANLGTQFSRSSTACQPFGTSPICVGPPPHRTSDGVTAWPN